MLRVEKREANPEEIRAGASCGSLRIPASCLLLDGVLGKTGRSSSGSLWYLIGEEVLSCLLCRVPLQQSGGGGCFSSGSAAKNLAIMQENGFDPWVGNIPWRNGNPVQYSCSGNPVERGAWWAAVHNVARVGHDLSTKQQQQSPARV